MADNNNKKQQPYTPAKKPLNKQPQRGRGGGRGPGMGISMPAEKPKDLKGTIKRLFKMLKPYNFRLFLMVLFTLLTIGFAVVAPNFIRQMINAMDAFIKGEIDNGTLTLTITQLVTTILALYALRIVVEMCQNLISNNVAFGFGRTLRKTMRAKLETLPIKYFDEEQTGNVLSIFSNDVDIVINSLQQSMLQMISSFFYIIGLMVMMFIISWQLTLIVLLILPIYILFTRAIAKRSQARFRKQQKYLGSLNGDIEEVFSGSETVKLYGKEADSYEEFKIINENLYKSARSATFLSGLIRPILEFISNIGYVAVVFVGGILAGAANPLLIGDITIFITYQRSFVNPILNLASIVNQIQSTIAGAERIFGLLDQPEMLIESTKENFGDDNFEGHVSFRNIDFSYDPERELIKNLDLDIYAGRQIAIVGPTGAGKTTLVNLLMRFYEIDNGNIYIDNIKSTDVPRRNLRSLFGMVLQDTWLFSGTIKENVAYGKENATDEEVISACKQAHVHHFIETLPDGYETVLKEDAANISQGQRQLLTIARAILSNPKILILDEATSSVDTRTESYIQNAMDYMMEGKTSFVIAHRLSTIKNANLILVMNEGRIVEQGNHKELLDKNGVYADLYNAQFLNQAT